MKTYNGIDEEPKNLRYLSYFSCSLEWTDISKFAQLEHFSYERRFNSPQAPLTRLLN